MWNVLSSRNSTSICLHQILFNIVKHGRHVWGQVRGDPAGDEGRHGQGVPQVHGVPEPAEHQPAASGQRPDQRQVRQAEAAGGGEGQARQGEGGLRGVEEEVLTLSDNQQSQDDNEVDFTLVQNNKINPVSI